MTANSQISYDLLKDSIARSVDYNKILNGDLNNFSKHKPKHCTAQSITDTVGQIKETVRVGYEPLKNPAPTLHFPLETKYLVFSDPDVTEEQNIINLAENFPLLCIDCDSPDFQFVKEVCRTVVSITESDKTRNMFFTGYPDYDTKDNIEKLKESKMDHYIRVRENLETQKDDIEIILGTDLPELVKVRMTESVREAEEVLLNKIMETKKTS
jgi:hypothetical protein